MVIVSESIGILLSLLSNVMLTLTALLLPSLPFLILTISSPSPPSFSLPSPPFSPSPSSSPFTILSSSLALLPLLSCMSDCNLSTLSALTLFSPRANAIASSMLLLPEPFGPVMHTSPLSRFRIVLFLANDLKPDISTFLIYTMDAYLSCLNK
ncbi:hypothetical protein HRbin04_01248 [archaeon HR04]|nr:hypothetical protein HRbin04_01248 [archaeon HR04]